MTLAIETALATILTGDPAVNALIVGRVYSPEAPQNAHYPHVVFVRAGGEPDFTTGGKGDGSLPQDTFDVFVISDDIDIHIDLSRKVKDALSYYRGVVTVGGDNVNIQSILVQRPADIPTEQPRDPPVYCRHFEIDVLYQE
jgi:hypothetical protein